MSWGYTYNFPDLKPEAGDDDGATWDRRAGRDAPNRFGISRRLMPLPISAGTQRFLQAILSHK